MQMQARFLSVIEMADPVGLSLHLATQHAIIKFIEHLPYHLDARHRLRQVVGKDRYIPLWRWYLVIRVRIWGIVTEQIVLDQNGAGVDPEAVYAALESETHDIADGLAHLFVAPA